MAQVRFFFLEYRQWYLKYSADRNKFSLSAWSNRFKFSLNFLFQELCHSLILLPTSLLNPADPLLYMLPRIRLEERLEQTLWSTFSVVYSYLFNTQFSGRRKGPGFLCLPVSMVQYSYHGWFQITNVASASSQTSEISVVGFRELI